MLHRYPAVGGSLLVALAGPALAQRTTPLPLDPIASEAPSGVLALAPRGAEIRALTGETFVRMPAVPTAGGDLVELELERIDLGALKLGFVVDGLPAPNLLEGIDLSVWTGRVVGEPGSDVVLSFSQAGVRGFVDTGDELTHWMPQPGADGDWRASQVWLVSEERLAELGAQRPASCGGALVPAAPSGEAARELTPPDVLTPEAGTCELFECTVAIETDWQLNQLFGNDLGAETAYVTSLLGAASSRYVEQVKTQLTFPYIQFHTTSNDGWSTPESGGSMIDMLDEFQNVWGTNGIPAGARLGHFVSGASLGGGVAYVGVLCDGVDDFFQVAVSGSLAGQTPFPITAGPFNWDFVVFTHETGHQFGSPHTHDYSPPIDTCASGGCISNGTIMSYCHQCPGGISNITTYFHPTVVSVIDQEVAACLPKVTGIDVIVAELIAPDTPTPVVASIAGTLQGPVTLEYRFDPQAAFQSIPMTDSGSGSFSAQLPGASCGSSPELFVSYTDSVCGAATSDVEFPEIGVETVLFLDELEVPGNWTAGVPGDSATTGQWERVDPIGTSAQPEDDFTPGGTDCYVTGQHSGGGAGSDDIDDGATTLLSPLIDLSSGDARISYRRWFHNTGGANAGQEVFTVDVSNDGGNSWSTVEVVGPTGPEVSGGWIFHEFQVSDVVAPTANVQVRFVAKDDVGALVEAGVDDFKVRRVSCGVCQTDLGFAGPGTTMLSLCGDALASGGQAELLVTGAPAQTPAWIVFGFQANPTPLYGGTVVPLPYTALVPTQTDAAGEVSLAVSGGGVPAPTFAYFQAFAFDLSLPFLLQFSNAIEATYLP